MFSDLFCPHCLRPIRTSGDDRDSITRCTTCGKSFAHASPHAMTIRPGMNARRDDDDDYDDDVEYEDDRPSRRGRSMRNVRPGKVQAIAIMTLIGGIVAVLVGLHWLVIWGFASMGMCCLWPGGYYSLVIGILGIVKGSQLLGKEGHLSAPPKAIAIMMIINIINGDFICLVMGILILVFCGDPEVEEYYQGSR